MSIPFYISPEQLMKDKAEYARKGIARGRSIVALEYDMGIILAAENPSSLTKLGELYDRMAFAGVGKFSEFDQLRKIGVRFCDMKGYAYSREDVRAKALANAYSQAIGDVFTREMKPLEVEVVVAEVGDDRLGHEENSMYKVQFDGSISDHHGYCVIGGDAESLETHLKNHYRSDPLMPLGDALRLGRDALISANGGTSIAPENLEVCTLDRKREGRKFSRASADEVRGMLG